MIALDGTPNKGRLGANALLGVSMALARASALAAGVPLYTHLARLYEKKDGATGSILPAPMMNILNGGAHADSSVDFQEFMVMPLGAASFGDALRIGAEIFHTLRGILKKKGYATGVGDEGGFAPEPEVEPRSAGPRARGGRAGGLQGRRERVHRARRRGERAVGRRRTSATSSRSRARRRAPPTRWSRSTRTGSASTRSSRSRTASPKGDWDGWKTLTTALGGRVQIVGDDLFVTNPEILKRGIDEKVANSILVKLNQIGTVTETLDAVAMARDAGYTSVISHRSGETEDTTIADLAVATGAGQIKTGSASRTDRVAKYNQLLRIEEALGAAAKYAGRGAIKQLR